jgi:hypothetical protein
MPQISGGTSDRPAAWCVKIQNHHSYMPPEIQVVNNVGSSTTPDSPSITPSWGSAKSLILTAVHRYNSGSALTSYPSGYAGLGFGDNIGSGDCATAVAAKMINAASEDPGSFTYPGGGNYWGLTVAVPPATVTPGICSPTNAQTVNTGSSVTPQTINLPPGIVNGDRVIVVIEHNFGNTVTTPSGWTQIYQTTTNIGHYAMYRDCNGSEGATVSVTFAVGTIVSAMAFKIKGHDTSAAPEAGTMSASATTTVDPPAVTPSWGSSKQSLFIAAYARNGGPNAITAYPSGYFGSLMMAPENGQTRHIGTALRTATVASENPGVFTLSGSNNTNCNTIAVKAA